MWKKFAWWFIVFGLSYLVSDVFGWTEQGKAFLYIHLGAGILICLALIVMVLIAGGLSDSFAAAHGISILIVIIQAVVLGITLFATWGATKLFGIDFYIAYEIMTFGQCLCMDNSKSDD